MKTAASAKSPWKSTARPRLVKHPTHSAYQRLLGLAALATTSEVRGRLTKRSADARGADDEGHGVELHGDVCGVCGGWWSVCEAGGAGRLSKGMMCDGTRKVQ